MTLEQLIRQQVEDNLKKATRLSTEAALTLDIWLRAIDREKAAAGTRRTRCRPGRPAGRPDVPR